MAYITRKFKGNQVWFRYSKDASICVSVTQVYCSLYWSHSVADSSLKVIMIAAPNFQSAIGSPPTGARKLLGPHWTTLGCTPNPESTTKVKGIDYVNSHSDWRSKLSNEEWGKSCGQPRWPTWTESREGEPYFLLREKEMGRQEQLRSLPVTIFWTQNASLRPWANSFFPMTLLLWSKMDPGSPVCAVSSLCFPSILPESLAHIFSY